MVRDCLAESLIFLPCSYLVKQHVVIWINSNDITNTTSDLYPAQLYTIKLCFYMYFIFIIISYHIVNSINNDNFKR